MTGASPEPARSATTPEAGWVSCPRCSRRARRGQPFCESCGAALLPSGPEAPPTARRAATCPQCSARVEVPEGQRTTTCPFCDTPYVAEGEEAPDRQPPEFVLPFSVPEPEVRRRLEAFLAAGGWFTPGDLRRAARVHEVRGVYLPCWASSTLSRSTWSARIGEWWWETRTETVTTWENGRPVTRTRTHRVRHTEWVPLEGEFGQDHVQHLVSGSRGLPQAILDALGPFPLAEMLRYQPHYLSGWAAEEYAVPREEAAAASTAVFEARELEAIGAFLPGDEHADLRVQTSFSGTTTDLVYLPVWLSAFRYRGRLWRYALNGATGRAFAERPRSLPRLLLAVLLGLAVLAGTVLLVRAAGARARASQAPAAERRP